MYLSKSDLQNKESISADCALKVWRENYYSGWSSPITLGIALIVVSVFLIFSMATWLIPVGILLVHACVAMPLSSENMRKAIKDRTMKEL